MKHLSIQEWSDLVESDPVLKFIERVNKKTPKHQDWSTNYALALYRTFVEEAGNYTIETHGVSSYDIASLTRQ